MSRQAAINVSIKEVAEVAGVHRTTASKVLNNQAGCRINEGTRKRILQAAHRLGFDRNDRFTSPSGVRSIGLLNFHRYSKQLNPFYSDVFDGIDAEAREQGLNIYLINNMERLSILHLLRQPDFLGVISVGMSRDLLAPFEMAARPIVGIEASHGLSSASLYAVRTDSFRGMQEATEYLLACGHQRIYYLTFLDSNGKEQDVSLERFAGVAMAMKAAGLAMNDNRIVGDSMGETEEQVAATTRGYRAMLELLKRRPARPFACVCYSDLDAEGAASAARERGLRIPEDVSLVGYDDIPRAAEMSPPLTTVHVPRQELGRQAVKVLLDIEGGGPAVKHEIVLPSRLIVRESVLKL